MALCLLLCGCKKEESAPEETTAIPDGSYYQYSSDGLLKTALITYKDGVEVSRDRYSYSLTGDLTKVETIVDGKIINTTSYNYEGGYLYRQADQYTDGGIAVKKLTTFTGDDRALPVAVDYYENDVFVGGEKYSYGENNYIAKMEIVGSDGNVSTYYEYDCDENGNIITARCYEFGTLAGVFHYDEHGNLIEDEN